MDVDSTEGGTEVHTTRYTVSAGMRQSLGRTGFRPDGPSGRSRTTDAAWPLREVADCVVGETVADHGTPSVLVA